MKVVVTGGAGFIGSHLVDALIERGDDVVVIDDLSNGVATNLNPAAEFVQGSIVDRELVGSAMAGAELVFHEAALGSVKRSIETPLLTDDANVHGSLTVLDAARAAGVRRVVAASSSSVYGGAAPLPSNEGYPTTPRSPYAVTKVTLELYCRVYAELLSLDTVCLRYFNVYGPRQRSDSAYAAVVPLFSHALLNGERPVIYGDGHQSRDFTYVTDAVQANLLAADAPAERCSGHVYNVGGGEPHSVLDLLTVMARMLEVEAEPIHEDPRPGDARNSQADLTAAGADLGYAPKVAFEDGLRIVCAAARAAN